MIAGIASGAMIADNTLRGKGLKSVPEALNPAMTINVSSPELDTVREPENSLIVLSGYDKPLRTSRETMLVTNNAPRETRSLAFTITYLDMDGRQLHERTDTLKASIPAGETRMVKFSTWDTQHSFYYHLGQRPRTARVTPYSIRARVNFVVLQMK